MRILAQGILAVSMVQVFPPTVATVEHRATLPESEERAFLDIHPIWPRLRNTLPEAQAASQAPIKTTPESLGVVTSAVSAVVVDRKTGAVLFEKEANKPRSIGSITKLMSAYVYLETNPDLEAPVSLQQEDVRYGGIQHLLVGDEIRASDMLGASLVGSDNSATAALVRLSGYGQEEFVQKMNEIADQIGMTDTRFVDATGLSSDNRSTALSVTKLLDVTLQNPHIKAATQAPSAQFRGASGRYYTIPSTDELFGTFMNQDPYAVQGGKTGYLPEAGYCFGVMFSKEGKHEISVVVLGSDTKTSRFDDAKALGAWVYKVYAWPDETF